MSAFTIQQKDLVNIITCPTEMGGEAVKEFATLTEKISQKGTKAHVFDFKECESLDTEMYRSFIKLKQMSSAISISIFSINLSKDIQKQIRESGLDTVFNPAPNMNVVLTKLGLKKISPTSPESIEFIKIFAAATQIAITKQANTPLTSGKPFAKKENYNVNIGIAGVINLVSPQFIGSISLLFPVSVFLEIYSNMLGETLPAITKESEDAAAELLNIIFGLAKMKLNNEKGYSIQKAIPTVLSGEKLHVATSNNGTTVVLPFETKAGPFFVEVVSDQS